MIVKILDGFEKSYCDAGTFEMAGLLGVCDKSEFDRATDSFDTVTVRFKNKKDIPRWYIKESRGVRGHYGYNPYEYVFSRKDLEPVG